MGTVHSLISPGNQSPSPPTEGDPEVGKTGTLVSPPARLPSAFFQIKTDLWRFPPSLSGRGSLQTDEKEPAVHQESAEICSSLLAALSSSAASSPRWNNSSLRGGAASQ